MSAKKRSSFATRFWSCSARVFPIGLASQMIENLLERLVIGFFQEPNGRADTNTQHLLVAPDWELLRGRNHG